MSLPLVFMYTLLLAVSVYLFFKIRFDSAAVLVSDRLPKVETRVVLVGEAGRNGALVKALQVRPFTQLYDQQSSALLSKSQAF